ncbi:MAG: hypothetical protein H6735_19330 [Alphaproteobacteria bacterium]|nr:hypothetical protein [Alphaproteobacteria bacterium]
MLVWMLACASVPEQVLPASDVASVSRATAEGVDTPPDQITVTRTSASGRSVVAGWEEEALGSRLLAVERDGTSWTLVDASWNADRPALSADGTRVAFVSGRTGLASVWIVPFEGGEPRQLTNVGLRRVKGSTGAPEGFVPPPIDDGMHFEGEVLTWTAPDGVHRVEAP